MQKALSPLIATILLIGLSIVLAVSIFGFAQGWFSGLMGGTEEKSSSEIYALQNARVDINHVKLTKDGISVSVINTGNSDVKAKLNFIEGEEIITKDISINKGEVFSNTYGDVSNVDKVIVSLVEVDGKAIGSNIWFEKEVSLGEPVLYFPFDNDTKDYSGNGNNGTIIGGVDCSVNGVSGKGCMFDGNGGYINIPDSSSLSPTKEMTIEAWIKPEFTMDSGTQKSIVGKSNSYFFMVSYGKYRFSIYKDGPNNQYSSVSSNEFATPNVWTHMVGTYNGQTLKMYINGSLVKSTSYSGSIWDDVDDLQIGKWWGDFIGSIDEVAIYDYALTERQVKDLYEKN